MTGGRVYLKRYCVIFKFPDESLMISCDQIVTYGIYKKTKCMDQYIKKFTTRTDYGIPNVLKDHLLQSSAQIVVAWYIIHTETRHTHVSLRSVRETLDPVCTWDEIGVYLNLLFQIHVIPEDIQLLQTIGEGNTVVVSGHYGLNTLVAIKQQLFNSGRWEISSHMLHEIITLKKIQSSTWAPKIYFQQVCENMIQIGMEYIPISCRQMIKFGPPKNKNYLYARRLMLQLLHTVHELHSLHNVAHRDIKPENIRFRSDGSMVLIDYDSCVDIMSDYRFTNRVCTASYRDPSLVTGQEHPYNYNYFHLDAFSCGCVYLFLLRGGKHAFSGMNDDHIHENMMTQLEHNVETFPNLPSSDFDVLKNLLNINPRSRMTIKHAIDALQNIE
jgi:serine/threonine protein kinase